MENEMDRDIGTDKDEDRLSILEKIERGEISIEDAEAELAQVLEEPEAPAVLTEMAEPTEMAKPMERERLEEIDVPTRRERKLALAEKFENYTPQMMVGMTDSCEWPWPDKNWQWMWQNFGYPVYISHSIDVTEESELLVMLHQGDLFVSGWDEPTLKINGAAFDVRTGQDENTNSVA